MADIKELVDKSKWADRTKANRISFITKLREEIDPNSKGLKFLGDFKAVTSYLLKKYENPSTRKNKILDIRAVLNLAADQQALAKYDVLNSTLIKKNEEYRNDNTVKDADRFVPYDDVLDFPQVIADSITHAYGKLFLSKGDIDALKTPNAKFKYMKALTDYITIILYVKEAPVRADWGIAYLDEKSDANNWFDSNMGVIHWNDFKNVKGFGKQKWKLSNSTLSNLEEYISVLKNIIEKPDHLLYQIKTITHSPFTREKFSTYFKAVNNKYMKKPLTINDYRHIYETHVIQSPHYNDLTAEDKQKIHDRLLHSAATAQSYMKVAAPISLSEFKESV